MRSILRHPLMPKLFSCIASGYTRETFKKDLAAGLTVGVIALPLALAFAIASGVEPARGLYTAVIAGFLTSLLGGSRVQISGPTGAFVVLIYATVQRHGYEGLVMATLMAAVLLVAAGICGFGRLIRYVPYPLIVGFTTGLALLIFSTQVKDFLGLSLTQVPADFFEKWKEYFHHFPTADLTAFSLGLTCLAGIIAIHKWMPTVPWGISVIILGTLFTWIFGLDVETIGSRYGALPTTLPSPSLPEGFWSLEKWKLLFPDAVAIAVLAGLESLLSSVMGDSMTGRHSKHDAELVAQGVSNAASVLCGGISSTGAIARTAANIKTGAQTPVAGMIHAAFLFTIMTLFSSLVSYIPLAALAAVLIMVAWNMAEVDRFVHLFKAPRGDVAVMLTAFGLTIFGDLAFAVQMAMVLALFLFMRRMSEKAKTLQPYTAEDDTAIPEGMEIYHVNGPLFFGVADKIKDLAHPKRPSPKIFLLDMRDVHILDASGMYALHEVAKRCNRDGTRLLLSSIHPDVASELSRFGFLTLVGPAAVFPTAKDAIASLKK